MTRGESRTAFAHPAWRLVRGATRLVALLGGLPLALLAVTALFVAWIGSLWLALGLALLLVLGVPLFALDRLLPALDPHDSAALSRVRGLPTDVLALVWVATAFVLLGPAIGATRPMLHATATRLDDASLQTLAGATRWLAGSDPTRETPP